MTESKGDRRGSECEVEKKVKEVEKGEGGRGTNLAGCVLHGTQCRSPSSSCSSTGNTDANA